MNKIRVGFVGAGFVGPIHIENVRRLGFTEVTALAEIDQDTANKKASLLGIPKAYGKWEDLVADPEIDMVHVTSSNHLHYKVSKACLEAKKHVICDKPLTLDTLEAKELVEIAKKAGVVNAVTFNLGFYPMVREAREIVARQEFGKVNLVYGRYFQDWLSKDTDYNWRVEAKYQGKTRVIADIGSHWMQMIQMILNKKITSVYADSTIFIPTRKKPLIEIPTFSQQELKPDEYEEIKVDTEDHATVMFKFEDCIKGVVVVCQVCPGRKNRIEWEITGSQKSISWHGEDPNKLWIGNRDSSNEELMKDFNLLSPNSRDYSFYPGGLAEGYGDSWKAIFSKIYNFIKEDGHKKNVAPDFPTFKEGYEIMLIIDSIVKSIEENRWVDINTNLS